jgi:zinc protease
MILQPKAKSAVANLLPTSSTIVVACCDAVGRSPKLAAMPFYPRFAKRCRHQPSHRRPSRNCHTLRAAFALTIMPVSSPSLTNPVCRQTATGLTIIAEQMPIEAVNFSLWTPTGSAVESGTINGMAHFLEHMIFKGTETLAPGEFERQVEQRGGTTNAMTSQDYTCYYVTIAPQDFDAIAPLQLDLVLNAAIPDEEFGRERQVVLEEIRRSSDNIRRCVFAQAMKIAFDRLPYRRPVLGPAEGVANFTAEQMRQFHREWYAPSNLTAVVVGNLPEEQMIATLEEQLSDRAIAPKPSLPSLLPEDPFDDIRHQDIQDRRLTEARLMMMWRVPGMMDIEETDALDVLARILGAGRTSRLVQDLREDRGLVTHIGASNMTHTAQGVFWISAHLPIENIPAVERAILEQIQKLHEELVTTAELDQIKRQAINQFIFGNETPSSRAGLYGYSHAVFGNLAEGLSYTDRIQALSKATLQTIAQKFLPAAGYRTLKMHP